MLFIRRISPKYCLTVETLHFTEIPIKVCKSCTKALLKTSRDTRLTGIFTPAQNKNCTHPKLFPKELPLPCEKSEGGRYTRKVPQLKRFRGNPPPKKLIPSECQTMKRDPLAVLSFLAGIHP